MTQKHPSPKLVAAQETSPPDDATTVDGVAAPDSEREELRSDSEPPGFNPFSFSVVTVPPGLRQEMLQAKLPRLDPKYFEDTVPPNQALEAPPPPEEVASPLPTRKPPVAIVATCLLGAALLIALAIVKSSASKPDPVPPTPKTIAAPTVMATPTVNAQASAVTQATTAVLAAAPASPSTAPPAHSEKVDGIVKSPQPATTHPPKASSVSKPIPPALASPPSPGTGTAAPVQTSWVNPR